jgi:hypothetical protein
VTGLPGGNEGAEAGSWLHDFLVEEISSSMRRTKKAKPTDSFFALRVLCAT